jgi:hypothetical protein
MIRPQPSSCQAVDALGWFGAARVLTLVSPDSRARIVPAWSSRFSHARPALEQVIDLP